MMVTNPRNKTSALRLSYAGILTALAILLSYFPEIPMAFLFPFAPWLKLDFSYIPMLLLGFSMGPVSGLVALVMTNLFQLLSTSTGGVGQVANIIIGACYLLPATLAYRFKRTRASAIVGMIIGTALMIISGLLSNRYILMPFFFGEKLASFNMSQYLIAGIVPFNLIKGVLNSAMALLLYKRLSRFLHNIESKHAH